MKIAKTLRPFGYAQGRQAQGKKRCEFCHAWFTPDPRTAQNQTCCSDPSCRKKRRFETQRSWRQKNPGYDRTRKEKIKNWARDYPAYWHKYRKEHPDYTHRDNRRRVLSRRKAALSAKQDLISRFSVEKLRGIQEKALEVSAKQDLIRPAMAGISELTEFLIWREMSAKQNQIAFTPAIKREYEYASGNLG